MMQHGKRSSDCKEDYTLKNDGKLWCVYKHTNISNGKVYIGITSQSPSDRWHGNGSGYKKIKANFFWNAINHYGWDNFKHEVYFDGEWRKYNECKDFRCFSEEEAKALEKLFIEKYRSWVGFSDCHGYNLTRGGEGTVGWKHTQEAKRKMRMKGTHLLGQMNPFFGKHHTDKTKRFLAQVNHEKQGVNNPLVQKYLTERKIIEVESGQVFSCAADAARFFGIDPSNLSGSLHSRNRCKKINGRIFCYYSRWIRMTPVEQKQFIHTQTTDKRIGQFNPSARGVINLTTGNKYATLRQAAQQCHCSESAIYACCRGIRESAGGFNWCYEKEDSNSPGNNRAKAVEQYDLSGVLLNIFPSMQAAANSTGTSYASISMCCNEKHRTAGGYIWRFSNSAK